MVQRIGLLYRLLGTRARTLLALTAALLVVERTVLAAGAIGITRNPLIAWMASAGVVALWGIRGLVRQRVTKETREKLTMVIAEAALERGADGSFLPGEEADAAVFEGRFAAEQVLVRHLPSLFAEPAAALLLLAVIQPVGVPVLAGVAAIATTAVLLVLLRNITVEWQRGAWRKYMAVARDTLTSIRAATELIASGHERAYLEKLRANVHDWTETAARAERSAALFQRIPFAAIVVLAVVLLLQTQSLELDKVIRLAVFFPPLAGLTRTVFELVRTAPRIHSLGVALDASAKRPEARGGRPPPEMPCEIRFESVSFAYGDVPVLRDVSFVWKPGEILGIRGPNGSGKSTLLKLMLGLLVPNAGRILVGGIDLRDIDLTAWRRRIAYLPQRPYVPEKASVLEAIRLTAPGLGEREARRELERMGVWQRLAGGAKVEKGEAAPLQVPVAILSVGVRQRMMLARVFAQSAELTLMDEPDENLDRATLEMLEHLAREPLRTQSTCIATHDTSLIAAATSVVDLRLQTLLGKGALL
jgi:ABC-type transport system involved in cytochrome bd biosynthesis fused ATPase/permease subunit